MEACEKCGKEMKMYYKPFCPTCDKPVPKIQKIYNLFRCFYYMEAHGHPNFKDSVWSFLCDMYNIHNDITITIQCPSEGDEDLEDYPEYKLITLMFQEIGIKGDSALFEVSW